MKNSVNLIIIFLAVIYLPMAWFMQYLVYKHIGATELMWFLFWVNVPFTVINTVVVKIAEKLNQKSE